MRTMFSISPSPLACATRLLLGTALLASPMLAAAFNSGSTGADGDFNPTVNTEVPLPPDGIFNYKSINIPQGVTVKFKRNAANTPAILLVQQDATIAGTLDVSGQNSANTGTAGDGNLADDGIPALGGPGGFDGGAGGYPVNPAIGFSTRGGDGQGPGGGKGNDYCTYNPNSTYNFGWSGSGGGFGSDGGNGGSSPSTSGCQAAIGGKAYGNYQLQPLIGGSGGGDSGGAGNYLRGIAGGGGGGALLLAFTGTVNVTGKILANGGSSGSSGYGSNDMRSTGGGGGSGGAIRIMATALKGNGQITANGGSGWNLSGNGGTGRIRLEAESNSLSTPPSPLSSNTNTPGLIFVPNRPALAITSVAGITLGSASSVTVPSAKVNPVDVVVTSSGVPVGTTVALSVKPDNDSAIIATPVAITGSQSAGSATLSVNLPDGASVLEASTSFIITAAVGDALAPYANNERVEKVTLTASTGGPGVAILTTVSGKTYRVPQGVLSGS